MMTRLACRHLAQLESWNTGDNGSPRTCARFDHIQQASNILTGAVWKRKAMADANSGHANRISIRLHRGQGSRAHAPIDLAVVAGRVQIEIVLLSCFGAEFQRYGKVVEKQEWFSRPPL
jgi:hypothetical protein